MEETIEIDLKISIESNIDIFVVFVYNFHLAFDFWYSENSLTAFDGLHYEIAEN